MMTSPPWYKSVSSVFGLRPRIKGLLFFILGVVALLTILSPLTSTPYEASTGSSTLVPNIYSNYRRIKEQAAVDYLDLRSLSLGTSLKEFPLCGKERESYVPCYNVTGNLLSGLQEGDELDRHCEFEFEREKERCVVRPPRDYKIPLRWPLGRDIIWSGNVKITKDQFLSSGTVTTRLMLLEENQITFHSEDGLVFDGVKDYARQIAEMIGLGSDTEFAQAGVRTVLDIGCGFGSFGAHLVSLKLMPICIAKYEATGSQVQLALERGLPAMIGNFFSKQLPYPALSFDMVHCAQCGITWDIKDAMLLLEVDRVLKPGGYFVLTSPTNKAQGNLPDTKKTSISTRLNDLSKKICWSLTAQQDESFLWQKTADSNCYSSRSQDSIPLCKDGDSVPYYHPLVPCISGTTSKRWIPIQNRSAVAGTTSAELEIHGIKPEEFFEDTQVWRSALKNYWSLLTPLIFSDHPKRPGDEDPLPPFNMIRNVMDMHARFGNLNSALLEQGKSAWVMNVVPLNARNTLPIVLDRGFAGVLHDWCEPFPTYPRTYDMLHANELLTHLSSERCSLMDLFLEMDRILRPEGWVVTKPCIDHRVKRVLMVDTVQEVAIYIHRFHNLDLFQQGWYQIKITMRWEDGDNVTRGIPSRVVQYEALESGSNGVWRIDDKDNSFFTQPFQIKYARQDVRLCMMISFTLPLQRYDGSATSAAILKFELMYAPSMDNSSTKQLEALPAAVHEFRIPPKALTGLHSYCPVHFDTLHAVLIDVSVHISVLKSAAYRRPSTLSRVVSNSKNVSGSSAQSFKKALGLLASADKKMVSFVKALLGARDILLEEMKRLSEAIGKSIDMSDFVSDMNNVPAVAGSGQGKEQNSPFEKLHTTFDLASDDWLHELSKDHLTRLFHLLGTQLHYLWNTFLGFHRDNNTKILEYLRDVWRKDRRAEWSIWMVYSKVEMPHHFINSGMSDIINHSAHKRASSVLKLTDPAQLAANRAELHRRSIAQMRINNRSIQDMQILGDPMRVPIIIIERVLNAPRRTLSDNSYLRHVDMLDSGLLNAVNDEGEKAKATSSQKSARELKIVVFVHGFQGHHLDLRLVRNQWLMIDPKTEFLMSEANEEKTHGDFREMGQRLAQEVVSFLKRKKDRYARQGHLKSIKLSFVGHSIGNVIIRTAIADGLMEPFRKYLHTYLSLSGPHLGYLYSTNSLFNSGLWLLKKLKSTQVIHQLTLTDDPDLRQTFFYKLCKQKTLEHFKNIILLSSPQDGYVPYHSARIESCQPASFDSTKRGIAFLEMLNNCMDQLRGPAPEAPHQQRIFMRCDVNFDMSVHGRNLNSFIGRAAHIEFLESDIFARFIMWSFQDLFR